MSAEGRRRRRTDGEDVELEHQDEEHVDGEELEERPVAGPLVAPVRRQVPATSRPLIGAEVEELPDDHPRRVPVERDALGKVTELVEAPDRRAADDWDERKWNR